jgi:hypothetical protein
MNLHLSFFPTKSKAFFSSKYLCGSLLTLVSSAILSQPAFANKLETYFFQRNYAESGYSLSGRFTAVDRDADTIISATDVIDFAATLTDNNGWQESIELDEEKTIADFYYDLNGYLSNTTDFSFQVDTPDPSESSIRFSSQKVAASLFPNDTSWKVNFTEDVDLFREGDAIIAGIDPSLNGFVTFIDDGDNGAKTPEASSLAGIVLVLVSCLNLKRK